MIWIEGIDVSKWQGDIDWKKVAAAGCRFAAIRATVGDYYTDPYFERNREGVVSNGIFPLYYHVVCPERPSVDQMDRYLSVVGSFDGAKPVMDIELVRDQSRTVITDVTKYCLDRVGDLQPLPYSNAYFWNTYIIDDGWSSMYDKWAANYRLLPPPALPEAWSNWHLWQWTSKGAWPGIIGAVDLNRFYGNETEFTEWINQVKEPEPELPPPEDKKMKWVNIRLFVVVGDEYTKSTPAPKEIQIHGLPADTRLVLVTLKVSSDNPDNVAALGPDGRMIEARANRPASSLVPVNRNRTFLTCRVAKGSRMRVWIEGYGCVVQQ